MIKIKNRNISLNRRTQKLSIKKYPFLPNKLNLKCRDYLSFDEEGENEVQVSYRRKTKFDVKASPFKNQKKYLETFASGFNAPLKR